MKRKVLSLLLALVMCLSLLPSAALASDGHTHYLCGDDCSGIGGHQENGTKTDFVEWTDKLAKEQNGEEKTAANSLPNEKGNYYLNGTVTLAEGWHPADGTVLCLNGKNIEAGGSFDTIIVDNGITFTLTDCKNSGKVKRDGTGNSGRGVYVDNTGMFNMYGGDVHGNSTSKEGAGVNARGTFNMYGGSITDNVLTTDNTFGGGGVCVGSAYSGTGETRNETFNMYAGTIYHNESGSGGGGVEISSGTFNMYDGSVNLNKSVAAGGGVYVGHNKFNMYGGSITENSCSTRYVGGGLYVRQYYWEDARMTVSGNAVIKDNKMGGIADDVHLESPSNYVTVIGIGEDGLKSKASIGVYTSLKPSADSGVRITEANDVDYSANFFSNEGYYINYNDDKKLEVTNAKPEHAHPICGKSCTHTDEHGKIPASEWKPIASEAELRAIEGAGNYYLTDDITLTSITNYETTAFCGWDVPDGAVLCLNGHNVAMKNPAKSDLDRGEGNNRYYNDHAEVLKVSGHFTLTDCKNSGEITHAEDSQGNKYNGRGVDVLGGTFDMYGGKISGNYSEYGVGGSGVFIHKNWVLDKKGVFNLYGGEISGNTGKNGGGVSDFGGEFNMHGGKIVNNVADSTLGNSGISSGNGTGGGVYVGWTSAFAMTGGEISGNTADVSGGGVHAVAFAEGPGSAEIKVSGGASVFGNTVNGKANNVYLENSVSEKAEVKSKITVAGELTGKDKCIGVTVGDAADGSVVAVGNNLTDAHKVKFFSDDDNYEIAFGGLDLVLKNKGGNVHTHVWTYARTDTNVIVARCDVGNCPAPAGGTVTIKAPENTVYDGQFKPAVLKVSDNWRGVSKDRIEIKYEEKVNGADWLPLYNPPSETGTYRAYIKLGNTQAYAEYTITEGDSSDVSGKIKFKDGTLTYTGKGLKYEKATITGNYKGSFTYTYEVKDSGALDEDGLPVAVGTYIVTATYTDGNYSGSKTAILTVKKASSSRPPMGDGSSGPVTYPVNISANANGTVSASAKNASEGSTVTVTVKPDNGYELETVTVTDSAGNELKLMDNGGGKYSFTMPGSGVKVSAVFAEDNSVLNFFYDVPNDAYYYEAVKWALEKGITDGIGNGLFGSDKTCTRAQIVTFLWRAAGSPEPKTAAGFSDVPAGAYYAKAVAWAVENGITTGVDGTRFAPDTACTRAQGMAFLFRASKASASGVPAFSDVAENAYYAKAVKWAADNGITNGIGNGLFGSDNPCTRAQIVTFLWRMYAGK